MTVNIQYTREDMERASIDLFNIAKTNSILSTDIKKELV